MGEVGVHSQVGGSVDWLCNSRMRKVHISIVSRDGRTTIRAHEKLASLAGAVFGGIVGGIGVFGIGWIGFIVGLNTFHSMPIALGAWGALVAASYTVARPIHAAVVARRQRQLQQVVGELGEHLAGNAAPTDAAVARLRPMI